GRDLAQECGEVLAQLLAGPVKPGLDAPLGAAGDTGDLAVRELLVVVKEDRRLELVGQRVYRLSKCGKHLVVSEFEIGTALGSMEFLIGRRGRLRAVLRLVQGDRRMAPLPAMVVVAEVG